jgi:uncharacterized damage-inducible protein DinB
MNGSLLQDAFAHHVWATLRVLDACAALTPAQLETAVPGTFGSILETLRHTVGADRSYLWVVAGGVLPEVEDGSMDLPALREVMAANGPAWETYLAGDLDPEAFVVRHRDDGTESGAPLTIRLAQVIHHGTDHRSQVCTALTSLGIEPPAIDAWDFSWKDGRLTETQPGS